MNIYSIYKSTNKINGKSYVGFDSDWPKRYNDHKRRYIKGNTKFYKAIKKYGWDNFEWQILYQSLEKDHCLLIMEYYFIKEYDSFKNRYNMTLGGEGTLNYIMPEEQKIKISNKLKGRIFTEQHKKNLKIAMKGHKDYRTEESKKSAGLKYSLKMKGVKKPIGFGEKISKIHKGKVLTEKQKNDLKEKWKLRPFLVCPHCNKKGRSNMKRYHFDNCKHILQFSGTSA